MNGMLYPEIQGMLGGGVDPKYMLALRAGLGMMSAPQGASFAQAFGQGGSQALDAFDKERQQRMMLGMRMAQMAEQKRMHDAQIKNYEAEAELRRQQAEERARKAKFFSEENMRNFMTPGAPAKYDEMSWQQAEAASPQKFDYNAMLEAGARSGVVDPEKLLAHRAQLEESKQKRLQRMVELQEKLRQEDVNSERAAEIKRELIALRRDQFNASQKLDRPKLKPGERWNPETERVEIIKGSDLDRRHSANHAKDYKALEGLEAQTDNALEKIDYILDPKNKDAFNANFGGYNAYLTQYYPSGWGSGNVQDMRSKIESLKSDMKQAGLQLMRQGGSIGQMTLAEWPIVERAVENLGPTLGEEGAADVLKKIRAHLDRIRRTGRDVYKKEWEDSQYYSAPKTSGEDPLGIR